MEILIVAVQLGLIAAYLNFDFFNSIDPKDGVIGRWLVDSWRFWVLRFRLMVKRGPRLAASSIRRRSADGLFWGTGCDG